MSDKIYTLSNLEMINRMNILENFLDYDGLIGYVAARNTRRLAEATLEYEKYKNELVSKYGKENEDGFMSVSPDNPNYDKVKNSLDEFANIKHEVTIFTITYDDVKGKLTGREILQIDWMIEDN